MDRNGVCALVLNFTSDMPSPAEIGYGDLDLAEEARALAAHLQIRLCPDCDGKWRGAGSHREELCLFWDEQGLSLRSGGLSLRGDFSKMIPRLRYHNLTHELLVKAAGVKVAKNPEDRRTAIDATAGMGEDSLLLAAAGFEVTLYERDPIIAALLRDTLRRATVLPELREIVARMHLVEGDSAEALHTMRQQMGNASPTGADSVSEAAPIPDALCLILLDPMFPEKRKNSLTKEKLQLIQKLERPCTDEAELLDAALGAGARRVVVKRPRKGPFLAGRKPSYTLTGRTVRYDCYSRNAFSSSGTHKA